MSKESRCGISISEYWRRVYMKVVARDNQKTLTDQELIALGLKEEKTGKSQPKISEQKTIGEGDKQISPEKEDYPEQTADLIEEGEPNLPESEFAGTRAWKEKVQAECLHRFLSSIRGIGQKP